MKKSITIIVLLIIIRGICPAQEVWLNRIRQEWSAAGDDTTRVLLLAEFSNYYKLKKPDSALFYGYKGLTLARKIKFPKGEVAAMKYLAIAQTNLGNDLKALQLCLQANKIAETNNLIFDKGHLMLMRGNIYIESRDYAKALRLFKESKTIFDSVHDLPFSAFTESRIALAFLGLNQLDSALFYSQLGYDHASRIEGNWGTYFALLILGKAQNAIGHPDLALAYFKQSLSKGVENENFFNSNFAIAQFYQQRAQRDSSIFYAKKSLEIAQASGSYRYVVDASLLLSNLFEKGDPEQSLQYSKKAIAYKDSLNKVVKTTTEETFTDFDEQERQREIAEAKAESQNRLKLNAFLGSTFTLLVIAFFLYRNSRVKLKAKQNIEKAYDQLKSTQSQLIQSEKMASLGELTAGIAHEIQNPLNFVNNFSEVNKELLVEMNTEIEKGNLTEAKALAKDIIDNEEKINHHGKRADSIVKGMLQHSRSSSGVKEPTDINALADEYLRLAYHGLRAKDKSFNATMKTDFDKGLGKINIIPQDIGRVILNLITNAFYAVTERKKQSGDNFEPTVSISTKKDNDKILISVKDNGNGIPRKVMDKIFQPFFTTKPTGQGTGLGLSLSYDIVKAHSGELKVETKEGEGAEFILSLPER